MSEDDVSSIDGYVCSCGRRCPAKFTRPRYCPSCAATLMPVRQYLVQWNEGKKSYEVKLNLPVSQSKTDEEQLIFHMPYFIAEHSFCSCGDRLTLSNHTIRKTNDSFELEALYVCLRCMKSESKSIIARLKRSVGTMWNETTKLELGPTGVKYEKKDASENKK